MNPLTVLEKVFSQLSVEDLKTCRSVSKAWLQESTIILRKSIVPIPIGTPAALRGIISLSKSSPIIPFTKFNFSSHFFSLPNCAKTFGEFLSVFCSELESLKITLDKESDGLFELGTMLKFGKLANVTFTGHGLDKAPCSKQGQEIPTIFKVILASSPRIEALSLIMDTESKSTVKQLIRFMAGLSNNNLRNVHSLEIYIPLGDEEMLHFSQMSFLHLKTLKCDFHRSCFSKESFKAFLSAQSKTLEYLKFDNYYGNSCYSVEFPDEMPSVTTLKIDGRSELSSKEVTFLPFSYTKQFPSLVNLVLGGSIEFNKCWKILFPDDTIVLSLKQLKLTARFVDSFWMERIGTIFPHLEKLYFCLTPKNEALAKVLFKAFEKVKELTIYFHPVTENMDHLFTGISEDVCHALRENKGDGLNNLGQIGEDVGLSNLKLLQTLRLMADKSTSHISDVTITHCLLKMDNLENVIMPPFQISQSALAQLSDKVNLYLT